MKRELASKIATSLIEGGIHAGWVVASTAQHCGCTQYAVKKVKKYLLDNSGHKQGSFSTDALVSYATAIDNGWADKELGLTA